MKNTYNLSEIESISIDFKPWDIVFLIWDLWAGKTTLISKLAKNIFWINERIQSPTFIHYKKYLDFFYHFDLYRLEIYDDFVNIWWEEILDNKENISFIEWPWIIESYYKPNYIIRLNKVDTNDDIREIDIEKVL